MIQAADFLQKGSDSMKRVSLFFVILMAAMIFFAHALADVPALADTGAFDGGFAIVSPEKNKWGVINTDGKYILDTKYESIARITGLNTQDESITNLKAVCAREGSEDVYFNLYPDYALEVGNVSAAYPFEKPYSAACIGVNSYAVIDAHGRILFGPMHKVSILEDGVVEAYTYTNSKAEYYTIDDIGNVFSVDVIPSHFNPSDYYPNEGEKTVQPVADPSLNKRVSKEYRLPHVDGEEALLPLFSALVQATYPDSTRYVDFESAPEPMFTVTGDFAWKRLINGEADMIFVQEPSEEQLAAVRADGADVVLTPIAMEAFVFIANIRNPASNLTLDDIKAVYSGKITSWDDLGVSGIGAITAYQCPRYSDIQAQFTSIMGDTHLMNPPRNESDPLNWNSSVENLEYRNLPGAIGFNNRFYCMDLVGNAVKFLSVDGIFPSEENIRFGAYPYAVTIYAVTRKGDENPNTAAFLKWIQSDEALSLIQLAGYVPIRKVNDADLLIEQACMAGSSRLDPAKSQELKAQRNGNLWGYVNAFGDMVIPARFGHAHSFEGDYALATDAAGYYGLINRQGAYVLPPIYSEIATESDDGTVIAMAPNGAERYYVLDGNIAAEISGVNAILDMEDYMPNEGKLVATLDDTPTLDRRTSKKHRLPCADGATALFPVYSAFVQAVYPDDTRYEYVTSKNKTPLITCTRTNEAYERLINGDADIIFVAEPSDAQVAAASEKNIEFEMTPFGKEAFVFIVNRSNPLENITLDQIRDIYSGRITDWDTLGVSGLGDIMAYQRPENSGSQTALQKLMGDIPLMEAPEGVVAWDMGDIIDTIEYRNLPNAIGYTFRFFCTELTDNDVKMLSINGVAPTVENIRSGAYPITSTLYAVTRKGDDNPNTASFLEWIQSDQGMELVEKSGYVPWHEPEIDLGTFDDPA